VDNLGARATSAPVAFSASFPASLSIDDQTVFESSTGTNAIFTLTLASPSCRTVSVDVVTRDGTALAGSDYLAVLTNIVFLPGETIKTVSVRVLGDNVVEPDETFFVCLTNQQYATLVRACGVGTILNDDTNAPPANLPPTVTITTPTNGAVFTTPPGLVPIEATAVDSDGVVVRVDFFSGTAFIGADTNAPFSLLWTNNTVGGYVLKAVATDDGGAKGTSAPVNITIRACSNSIAATPLQDQLRCVCDEVIFSTTVTSADPVTYRWLRNGSPLPGEVNPTLHLQGLKLEHAGVYTVEITSPCANTSRSATLTIRGAGNQNPVSFTNATRIILSDNTVAQPYPSALEVFCVPGPLKHLSVTLDGLSHNFPDDVDILLVSPSGQSVKLISDCGGTSANKLTNVVLTFTDTATQTLPDTTRITSGVYAPTDFAPADTFPAPAPTIPPATSFAPFLGTNANGVWSLFARDDQGGDAGQILRGWFMTVEWQDTVPFLSAPRMRLDGSFELTMLGLPHMTHVIEASSDLRNWTPISTNTPLSSTTLFVDPYAASSPSRFYRAVRCP
jgi:subtilisin-like proprotein convertase family protein